MQLTIAWFVQSPPSFGEVKLDAAALLAAEDPDEKWVLASIALRRPAFRICDGCG